MDNEDNLTIRDHAKDPKALSLDFALSSKHGTTICLGNFGSDPDIFVTNGKVGFHAHRKTLQSRSGFFTAALLGDTESDELLLPDLPDTLIRLLQVSIYGTNRAARFELRAVVENDIQMGEKILQLLVRKYDFRRIGRYLQAYCLCTTSPCSIYITQHLTSYAKQINLNTWAKILLKKYPLFCRKNLNKVAPNVELMLKCEPEFIHALLSRNCKEIVTVPANFVVVVAPMQNNDLQPQICVNLLLERFDKATQFYEMVFQYAKEKDAVEIMATLKEKWKRFEGRVTPMPTLKEKFLRGISDAFKEFLAEE